MLKTLKILDQLLTVNPKAESAITSFTDRISLLLPRLPKDTVEVSEDTFRARFVCLSTPSSSCFR